MPIEIKNETLTSLEVEETILNSLKKDVESSITIEIHKELIPEISIENEKIETISQQIAPESGYLPFPNKKYDVIYADPPWQYNDLISNGNRGAAFKYEVQSLDYLKKLPIQSIANPNGMLFMWVTGPMMKTGLELIDAWGFSFKSVAFTWVKVNKNKNSFFLGLGHLTRGNPEYCLIGINKIKDKKTKLQKLSNSVENLVVSRIREHSRKPDIVRRKIVELLGDIPRIELFARQKFDGWDCWGNQVEISK